MKNDNYEEKILDLFYSNEPANDLLIFELVKQFSDHRFSIVMLISLLASSRENRLQSKIRYYVRSNYPEKYYSCLDAFRRFRRADFSFSVFQDLFIPSFSKIELLEIVYRRVKRLGNAHDIFLVLDHNDHPKRQEVFQDFLAKHPGSRLDICGLFPDELTAYAKLFTRTSSYHSICINNLKTNYLPVSFLSLKCWSLTFRNDLSTEVVPQIPDFIFRYKQISHIKLDLHPNTVFPEDWSSFSKLESFEFIKLSPVFQNLNFLDNLPMLKKVEGILLQNKELLMEKPSIEIMANYKVKGKDGRDVYGENSDSLIAQILKKSILPYEKQKYYFSKITNVRFKWRDRENDRCGFTEEEIKELSKIDFDLNGGYSFTMDFLDRNKLRKPYRDRK